MKEKKEIYYKLNNQNSENTDFFQALFSLFSVIL